MLFEGLRISDRLFVTYLKNIVKHIANTLVRLGCGHRDTKSRAAFARNSARRASASGDRSTSGVVTSETKRRSHLDRMTSKRYIHPVCHHASEYNTCGTKTAPSTHPTARWSLGGMQSLTQQPASCMDCMTFCL